MSSPAKHRPTYTIRVRAEPGIDPIRSLRALLKVMLRKFGLRAISIDARLEEEENA
jgi:hypothetical protein